MTALNKAEIVKTMVGGVGMLLKSAGVTVVSGVGTFTGPNTIAVEGGETHEGAMIAWVRQKTDLGDGREVLELARQAANALDFSLRVGEDCAQGVRQSPHS